MEWHVRVPARLFTRFNQIDHNARVAATLLGQWGANDLDTAFGQKSLHKIFLLEFNSAGYGLEKKIIYGKINPFGKFANKINFLKFPYRSHFDQAGLFKLDFQQQILRIRFPRRGAKQLGMLPFIVGAGAAAQRHTQLRPVRLTLIVQFEVQHIIIRFGVGAAAFNAEWRIFLAALQRGFEAGIRMECATAAEQCFHRADGLA